MTLDEQILVEAKEVRQHLVDLESQTAHARVDYHHAIKKLHAAGGSLREIAEALDLSHQRVHQIVEGPAGPPGGPPWAGRRWKQRRHGNRRYFIARFDDDARGVIVEAQKEADSLKHPYLGTEHLMLAIVRRGVEGVSYDAARQQIVERIGELTRKTSDLNRALDCFSGFVTSQPGWPMAWLGLVETGPLEKIGLVYRTITLSCMRRHGMWQAIR